MKIHHTLALSLSFIFLSCKKDYTCECKTIDPQQGFINPETYHVKEKTKKTQWLIAQSNTINRVKQRVESVV